MVCTSFFLLQWKPTYPGLQSVRVQLGSWTNGCNKTCCSHQSSTAVNSNRPESPQIRCREAHRSAWTSGCATRSSSLGSIFSDDSHTKRSKLSLVCRFLELWQSPPWLNHYASCSRCKKVKNYLYFQDSSETWGVFRLNYGSQNLAGHFFSPHIVTRCPELLTDSWHLS